nr:hypothetical protein [Deltaproteobacteria bacterium]
DALPFPGKQSLAPFVARAEGRTTEPPEPGRAPKPTKVTSVPTEACEENPEDCGTASPLRGTAYWIVTVSNSRGDFYHEASQLYDPKDGMFFDPRRPGTRSKEPLAETDGSEAYRPTWISPSGALSMSYDELVRFEGGIVARDLAGTCGFWGGGWTVDLGG